ncbi:Transposase family Tnp2 protein [Ceratobasidium theobromae]|uniref:Transposase family Tnp2 protein n=1 Tax=Ceratobasidium theobromae TaxID=1582974 RepID=A0A5N5Q9W0_9AGAM|nr:Transposase family Tnp2 protein [Ceratobasidium theobromae]
MSKLKPRATNESNDTAPGVHMEETVGEPKGSEEPVQANIDVDMAGPESSSLEPIITDMSLGVDTGAGPDADPDPDPDPDMGVETDVDANASMNSLANSLLGSATHGPCRNPPVTIEDWPDPKWDPPESEESDIGDEPIDSADHDPEYVERTVPLGCDPTDEPELTDEQMRQLLEVELGDLADTEWIDMYDRIISPNVLNTLKFLATRLRTHFSRSTYEDLRHGVCASLDLPSEFIAWRRLRILSQLETRSYDCCVNSCCCFLGKYKDVQICPFCKESRYNPSGKRRRAFQYSPLIPQLVGLFQSCEMASKLQYRAQVEQQDDPDTFQDVFDGEHYRTLRQTQVFPDNSYRFFDNPEDLALGLSTDGFTLFKRRRRGLSTAWPLILVNYNLHPKIRTRLENVLCIGVIPGPKQPRDINSFLIPLLDELLELEQGVEASGLKPNGTRYNFKLRAFIIIIFGDIPAISKLLMLKGHNAFSPCRTCYIEGVLCKLAKSSIYYVPLMAPNKEWVWLPEDLPMRSHHYFLAHYNELESATDTRDDIAKMWGIKGEPIFSRLGSVDLSTIAPYDIMHLLFENLVPNMVQHWTGKFKGLDQGSGSYQLSAAQWVDVGKLTANAVRTIPSAFVGTLPDIAKDGNLYKAEAYSFWIQYIAPIVLKDQLREKYYKHLLLLREIILQCLQLRITTTEIDTLQLMVNEWVKKYEEYYYQYQVARLPTCPLTIHALLHMPFYLRKTGPLWASWAFVMERFCGHLLPAVKNRARPYDHLDNYVQRRAQMQIVSNVFNLPSLSKPIVKYRCVEGVEISTRETIYPAFPEIVLGTPKKKLGLAYDIRNAAALKARVKTDSIVRYGRFRIAGGGDSIRTAKQVMQDPDARDNSYVRYVLLPDANAAFQNRPDVPVRQTQYGQLLDIYYVEFFEENGFPTPFILARIQPCDTCGLDAALPQPSPVKYTCKLGTHIVHIMTIEAVIGRVKLDHGWAIIDRSREAVHTQFVNDDGNELD